MKRAINIRGKRASVILDASEWATLDRISNNNAAKWINDKAKERPAGYSINGWIKHQLFMDSIAPDMQRLSVQTIK